MSARRPKLDHCFRLLENASEEYTRVVDKYKEPGACVNSATDLIQWMNTRFGTALVSTTKVLIMVSDDGVPHPGDLYFSRPKGKLSPDTAPCTTLTRRYKRQPGTCVWEFDTKVKYENARTYHHVVVKVGAAYVDWGFDQFMVPAGYELYVCE